MRPAEPPAAEAGPLYSERLLPGATGWTVTIIFAASVFVMLFPADLPIALGTSLVTLLLGIGVAWVSAPRVVVHVPAGTGEGGEEDPVELRAGRARIPVDLLGEPQVMDAAATRAALGPSLDARAFACLRGWIPTMVRFDVLDPRDPAPYWLVSTRRPAELAAVVRSAQGAPRV